MIKRVVILLDDCSEKGAKIKRYANIANPFT